MPRRYRKRSRPALRRRKINRRFKRRGARTTVVNRGIAPIAARFITKLRYADEQSFSSVAGVPVLQVFNLNSLFDPDRTGGGHQPYGFDQIAALYDYYRVFAVSWIVEGVGSTSGDVPRMTVLPYDGLLNTIASRTQIMEMARAITKDSSHGNNRIMIKGRITLPKLRGQTSVEYKGDDNNRALVTASPTDVLSLGIWIDSAVGATTNCTALVKTTLVYHCEFFDPQVFGQS